ncbi:hypothetical protein B0H12DRAFT_1048883, partial [Mycena haematopus]
MDFWNRTLLHRLLHIPLPRVSDWVHFWHHPLCSLERLLPLHRRNVAVAVLFSSGCLRAFAHCSDILAIICHDEYPTLMNLNRRCHYPLAYIIARLILITLYFTTLRALPPNVFVDVTG